MDSDSDDYEGESALPCVPEKDIMADVDVTKLRDGVPFTFSIPDVIETEGFQTSDDDDPILILNDRYLREFGPLSQGKDAIPIVCHKPTQDRMDLKIWNMEDQTALATMVGDFTDIENFMNEKVLEDGSIKKVIITCGTGLKVEENHLVTAHYIISAEHMDDLIESTYQGRARRYRVGVGELLPVLDIGLQTMRVGEVAKFLAEPQHGFGKLGVPLLHGRSIPPDTRILVQVEVLNSQSSEKNDNIAFMSPTERRELGYDELYKYAVERKNEGNREFGDGDYEVAIKIYRDALDCVKELESMSLMPERKDQYVEICQAICNNLSQSYFKLGKYKIALKFASRSSEFAGGARQSKAHYLTAKALYQLGRYKESLAHAKKAYALKGTDKDIRALLEKADAKVKEDEKAEKLLCGRMMNAALTA